MGISSPEDEYGNPYYLSEFFCLLLGHFGIKEAINLTMILGRLIPGTIVDVPPKEFNEYVEQYFPISVKKRLYWEGLSAEETLIAHIDFMAQSRIPLHRKRKTLFRHFSASGLRKFLLSPCFREEYDEDARFEIGIAAALTYNADVWEEVSIDYCNFFNLEELKKLTQKYQDFCVEYGLPINFSLLIVDQETGGEFDFKPEIKEMEE